MKYEEAVEYILDIPKFTVKNDLQHTRDLLAQLGHPEQDMKLIHVAGTNGKGSVCAYMAAVLKRAGHCVGLFSSPHLIRINERFQINGEAVADDVFVEAFECVYEVVQTRRQDVPHPTFFEFLFLMAMVLFRRQQTTYVLLETGIGGRLDATNAIAAPELTVITSIGMDHTAILGDTITAIAREKAGIMKPGVPLVCDGRQALIRTIMKERAQELGVPIYCLTEDDYEICRKKEERIVFLLKNRYSRNEKQKKRNLNNTSFEITGSADYQAINAILAVSAIDCLEEQIGDEQIRDGLAEAFWPGRMEQVSPGVYLDGAHNPDGIRALNLRLRQEQNPVGLLFACTSEKDPAEMARQLCENVEVASVVLTETAGERGRDPEDLVREFCKYVNGPVVVERDNRKSLKLALQLKAEQSSLFVAGSLYLIGSIKQYMEVSL